jgi:hypothetical protein
MVRLTTILLLAAGLVGGSLAAETPRRKAMFCPECWKFLEDPWDLDLQGRCVVSGKKPVELEATTLRWFWCGAHRAWHRRPCGKNDPSSRESIALQVPDGSERMTMYGYCPGDRRISDLGHAGLACPVCSRPFVGAETVERRWYWCRTEKSWLKQICPASRSLHCCSPRNGAILAAPWQPPMLRDIALGAAAEE